MKCVIALFFSFTITAFAQEAYETAPVLKASEILKPEILAGPNYRVLENVITAYGRNRYTLETPWGYMSADGDPLLIQRVAEVRAMTELENISGTEEFKSALKTAARTPLNAAKELISDPGDAVKNSAKGLWKFANRTGESAKNLISGRKRGQGEDRTGKDLLGFSKAKREVALSLGTDPYSSNEVFQDRLEQIAWARTAGGGAFKIATLPIGGGVGMVLTAAGVTQNFQQALRDLSPADLRLANKKVLMEMGVEAKNADRFLANPAFSPTNQTAFVAALRSLTGVKNRTGFVAIATKAATEEGDAIFLSHTAQLLAALHNGQDPLVRIVTIGDLPAAMTADGRLVLALQWDTAFWSEPAEGIIDAAIDAKLGQTGVVVALTGSITPRAKAELEKRKVTLVTHVVDGPQR